MLDNLKDIQQKKLEEQKEEQSELKERLANISLQETIVKVMKSLVEYLDGHTSKTVVVNQLKEIKTPDALRVAEAVNSMHDTLKTHENTDISPLVEVMNRVLKQTEEIPKSHKDIKIPEQKDWSKQFKDLESAVKLVTKAIKDQKTVVEAPIVNVEAPNIEVEAQDLTPLGKKLETAFTKAVGTIKIPEVPKTDLSKLEELVEGQTKLLKRLIKVMEEMPIGGSSGLNLPQVISSETGEYVLAVANADGSLISGGGGTTDGTFDFMNGSDFQFMDGNSAAFMSG